MPSKQETFDKVSRHLLTQNEESLADGGGSCLYLSSSGLKCAIGCLMKMVDELTEPDGKF